MHKLFLLQSAAGKSVNELGQERSALLEKAKTVLGEDNFEIHKVSPAIGMAVLHGNSEGLNSLFCGDSALFWMDNPLERIGS